MVELKKLPRKLESYPIESKDSWLRTHFSFVYRSIFDRNEFKETALVSILKRDDLQVEEIKIWDYNIKWEALKITLQQCLPLIRYFYIPGEDIWEKHVAEISSWIDRKLTIYSLSNIPYEFQLILRRSRDGFHSIDILERVSWIYWHNCDFKSCRQKLTK
ncbi:hypothetical protein Glove_87g280 [Diversispora epigaea]|uniref:Uncharacterized protein n=1 Tax=Diversispora epigaea TaxID=1348612 RepID=A0A397J6P9_9GLOM|nr:hypothetical protein Glove_87g280 [Diversispora epigaea]